MSLPDYRRYVTPAIFALTIFSLVWRQGKPFLTSTLKPFEVFLVALFLLILFEFIISAESRSLWYSLKSTRVLYGMLLGALCLFMLIGSISVFSKWLLFAPQVYLGYANIALAILVFFISTYVVIRHERGLRWGLLAMLTSPLLFFAAFVPRWESFFIDNARLVGMQDDPNITASFIAISLLIASVLYLYRESHLRWLGVFHIVLVTPLFLWTNSRGSILAFVASFILLLILYLSQGFSRERTKAIFILFCLFIFSISMAFIVLPKDTQISIYERSIRPVLSNENLREIVVKDWILEGDNELYASFYKDTQIDSFDISRGDLWRQGLDNIIKSPLGFGPAYQNWNPIQHGKGAHNFWLQVPLTAGWGGFLLWIIFLGVVSRNAIKISKKKDFIGITLSIIFLFFLISGIFIDILTLKGLWFIMGMIVGYATLELSGAERSNSTQGFEL
ncbi:MAG: hypothetical protein COT89_00795 [Candidatus Colwellbacteria bacterium CG10_big_fil_rev_8_21_14_0_10_42_22]|uniref:O-antigen ligase-related domain-containing protein n=1 Tax=Candidatus Colwellbacteria bacterium CG10_big_fil_rev_8_21_14_0_10_42_22 TaxID=1974540 RepID=A0A2H0VGM9_9BACT|nr:MAG: hypothetical protein COT89_00795 [Candidatus Colwellbacteria bacterium CG10_big_fil_rev_8_21_14_0_10_42_22]